MNKTEELQAFDRNHHDVVLKTERTHIYTMFQMEISQAKGFKFTHKPTNEYLLHLNSDQKDAHG